MLRREEKNRIMIFIISIHAIGFVRYSDVNSFSISTHYIDTNNVIVYCYCINLFQYAFIYSIILMYM